MQDTPLGSVAHSGLRLDSLAHYAIPDGVAASGDPASIVTERRMRQLD
jgi:hypothetical protein